MVGWVRRMNFIWSNPTTSPSATGLLGSLGSLMVTVMVTVIVKLLILYCQDFLVCLCTYPGIPQPIPQTSPPPHPPTPLAHLEGELLDRDCWGGTSWDFLHHKSCFTDTSNWLKTSTLLWKLQIMIQMGKLLEIGEKKGLWPILVVVVTSSGKNIVIFIYFNFIDYSKSC